MKHEKEKVLTEAATSVQDKPETLQEDLSITELVMQVLRPTMEIIETLGESDSYFSVSLSDSGLYINVSNIIIENGRARMTRRIEMVDAHINAERWGKTVVADGLKNAAHTMNDMLRRVRKEAGNEK